MRKIYSGDWTVLYPKLVLLTIFLSIWAVNPDYANAAVTADWGDIVDIIYSLYLDEEHTIPKNQLNLNNELDYIYLSRDNTVPSDILKLYPQANANYLPKFLEAIIGMQVDGEKAFKIAAADAYGDEDLYYDLKLLKIWYDASGTATTTSSATTTSLSTPSQDFNTLIFVVGSVAILGGGFVLWALRSSRIKKSALSNDKRSSSLRVKTIQKDKAQLKELRELTESLTSSEESMKKQDVKFRRRRK